MNSIRKPQQSKPVVAQLKTAAPTQTIKHPVAPPVYRPQPVPKVLQKKSAIRPHAKPISAPPKMADPAQLKNRPVAPPVYRPQRVPKVLQTKMAAAQHSPAIQPKRPAVPAQTPPHQQLKPSRTPVKIAGRASRSVQLQPGAAYMALVPRPAGMPIPLDAAGHWVKPAWLRNQAQGPLTIRNEVAARRNPDVVIAGLQFYKCGLCGQLATLNGFSVDHAGSWEDWCRGQGAHDLQSLEYAYHDMENLRLVHNNCNASKGTRDLFDWWKSHSAHTYVQAETLHFIQGALQRICDSTGVLWLWEIPDEARIQVLDGIIQQATGLAGGPPNAFDHLMGNAAIVSAMGTWEQG